MAADGDLLGTPRPEVLGLTNGIRDASGDVSSCSYFTARLLLVVAAGLALLVGVDFFGGGFFGAAVAYHLAAVHRKTRGDWETPRALAAVWRAIVVVFIAVCVL